MIFFDVLVLLWDSGHVQQECNKPSMYSLGCRTNVFLLEPLAGHGSVLARWNQTSRVSWVLGAVWLCSRWLWSHSRTTSTRRPGHAENTGQCLCLCLCLCLCFVFVWWGVGVWGGGSSQLGIRPKRGSHHRSHQSHGYEWQRPGLYDRLVQYMSAIAILFLSSTAYTS